MALMASRWGSKYPSIGLHNFSRVTHTHTSKKWGEMDGMVIKSLHSGLPEPACGCFVLPRPPAVFMGALCLSGTLIGNESGR